jgi:hypothetical protein
MEHVAVKANRMKVPDTGSQTNMTQDALDPFFVIEQATITVGVSGGTYDGPRDFVPKESEFYERRTISRHVQWEAAFEVRTLSRQSLVHFGPP